MDIQELQQIAESSMTENHINFVNRGAYNNWTRDRNRTKLDEISINPRLLRDITGRDISTTVQGEKISFPVMCAPAGGQCASHPDGELATARAAGRAGTLMVLPVGSGYTIEQVSEVATGPIWFQHIHYSDGITEEFLPRLKPAGYSAVVLTVDAIGPFNLDKAIPTRHASIEGKMFGSLEGHDELLDKNGSVQWEPPNITWQRLKWIKTLSDDLPLIIKGIRNAEDALLCAEYDVDGVVVSNHGGRQFDGGRSSIEILPEVVNAIGDYLEVYFDSGVRSGLDVFKALAMGARAAFVGRPIHWGLAHDGEAGVSLALEILRSEFDKVFAFSGCRNVAEVNRDYVKLI